MTEAWVLEAKKKIETKMALVSDRNRGKIPYTTDEFNRFDNKADESIVFNADDGINWWTNGFWAGSMWLLYQTTKDMKYRTIAEETEELMDRCFKSYLGLHHDVGFMYIPTSVANYRITGSLDSRTRALHAANLLAGRFNIKGNFIRAWNDIPDSDADTRGWVIIDCMINISLLYWASRELGDPRYKHIAMAHADTVMKYFIRPDGSSIHIGTFDPEAGTYLGNLKGQGYSKDSSWTRGQGWAIYGFAISYIHTGKQEYLDTAVRVAEYCLGEIGESPFIPIDFKQPVEDSWEDSCGALVIASGMLSLAEALETEGEKYLQCAKKIVKNIVENRCDFNLDSDAMVLNCTGAYDSIQKHVTMNYADYYLIECIEKLSGTGFFMW